MRNDKRFERGCWVVAFAFVVLMMFTTLPTPLYPLYQERDNFSAFMITVIFAVYGAGVMVSLYLAGHVSDWMGRRRILLIAAGSELVSALMFVFLRDVTSLIIARFISGLGIGAVTSTATAYIVELRAKARPDEDKSKAQLLATAANSLGLGLGPVVAGALAQWLPQPLLMPYLVVLVLIVGAVVLLWRVPETVDVPDPLPGYHPQHIAVEDAQKRAYLMAALGALAAFAVNGFFTSLTAEFVRGDAHITSLVIPGIIGSAVLGASPVAQVLFRSGSHVRRVRLGRALMVAGLVFVIATAATDSLALFVIGGVLAGGGTGLVLNGSIETGLNAAQSGTEGAASAGIFLAAYFGMTVPVVGVGLTLLALPIRTVMWIFAIAVIALVVVATTLQLRSEEPAAQEPSPSR